MLINEKNSEINYTHIVVGAGSSGCVVAARLAANPNFNVLLIEAGPDYSSPEKLPIDLSDATVPSQKEHDWGIKSVGTGDRTLAMVRGKVVGGSSAVNACIALRAEPSDFDEWLGSGGVDWSWQSVLPYYKKLESDLDLPNSEFHGSDGPLPIRRWKRSELHPLSVAMIEACSTAKFNVISDHNMPESTGCGTLPMNAIDGKRFSTADVYLSLVRGEDNFTIVSGNLVDRILFQEKRAVGVLTVSSEGEQTYYGDNIILSAGAFGTPAILLRSGVGAASDLNEMGIPIIADLPGVGANLSDHSQVPIGIIAQKDYTSVDKTPCIQVLLRYSGKESKHANDMQVCLLNEVEIEAFVPYLLDVSSGKSLFLLTSNLMLPESRGRVYLKSSSPVDNPAVEINFCASDVDLRRHRDGLRLACSLLKESAFEGLVAKVLEADLLFGDDKALDQFILSRIQTAHHPCGTAKMGPATDPMSVVDTACGVIGIDGLYIADASIMPAPIRANTNLTCIMIGERVAAGLEAKSGREQ